MWNLLTWLLSMASWLVSILWHLAYPLLILAGFARIAWEAFQAGRKYQMARIREMLSRVREGKREELPAVAHVERDAA